MTGPCIFPECVATWRHWHYGFPGGYDNPADPEGPPIPFEGDDPEPGAVRDYNGAALPPRRIIRAAVVEALPGEYVDIDAVLAAFDTAGAPDSPSKP